MYIHDNKMDNEVFDPGNISEKFLWEKKRKEERVM